jgi:hypothetical protein
MECGRRDSNPHEPLGSTDFLTIYGFHRPCIAGFVAWTIPSPCPESPPGLRRCPSSLYTFPKRNLWSSASGLARDCHLTGSPEFEQFYIAGFPIEHSSLDLSPVRLPIPPRPHAGKTKVPGNEARATSLLSQSIR